MQTLSLPCSGGVCVVSDEHLYETPCSVHAAVVVRSFFLLLSASFAASQWIAVVTLVFCSVTLLCTCSSTEDFIGLFTWSQHDHSESMDSLSI